MQGMKQRIAAVLVLSFGRGEQQGQDASQGVDH